MTMIHRRATRVRSTLSVAAGLALAACGSSDSLDPSATPDNGLLAPGQSATLSGTRTLTLEGGATGTENVVVVVDTGIVSGVSAKTTYQLATTGTGAAGAVSGPATALVPLAEAARPSGASAGAPLVDIGFGMRLNARNRVRFDGRLQAARSAFRSGSAVPDGISRSVAIADAQVGDVFSLNVSTASACSASQIRGARVVAIGTQSIILSDTLNPSGGFTTADFQRFAARFDTLVYPLDVTNFGTPADIDQNKKIVLLFTTAVNALTPPQSESYVAGFFFDRDLFPTTDSPELQGCAGSNYSEMFYLLAPDPTGSINGNKRPTSFVDTATTSVLAHEFQHLINASRRIYVTQGVESLEVTWLNEGLSHIAEELLFYHESKLTPRQNIDSIKIRSAETIRLAFNSDMGSNTSRYRSFLVAPSENSPFRDDDSLETRGATWNLLRYLADRKGGVDAATWQALVNTKRVGVPNLVAVFGSDIASKVRDWNVSHYTDDISPGLAAEHLQPSWDWHSIFKALARSGQAYPLEVKTLTGGSASGTLIGGAAAYYRFSIPANTTATLTLTTPGPINARVVRIR
jgi:hypothetical protein